MMKTLTKYLMVLLLSSFARGAEFRVAAYNIKHGQGMDKKIDLKRTAEVIAGMKADVVTLQEVDKNCARSGKRDIAAELAAILKMDYRFGASFPYDGGEYGLAVLSRLPILGMKQHKLPGGSEPRTAFEVQVKIEGVKEPVSVVSIHNDWVSNEVKVGQVKALLNGLAEVKHPVVLAGDFNALPGEDSMKILAEKGWTILDKKGVKTCPADEPTKEIDYIVTLGLPWKIKEHKVVEEKVASDHRPIYAVWEIPAGGS